MRPPTKFSAGAFLRNLAANWVGLAAEVVVAFLLTPFILNRLGLAAYGLWGVLNSLIGYMGLVDLGVRGSLGRFVNFHLARDDSVAARQAVVTTLAFLSMMAGLALAISFPLGAAFETLFPKTPAEFAGEAMLLLPLMALGLWLSFVAAVLRTVVAAYDRFDLLNLLALVLLALRAAGTVVALNAGHGLIGLVVVNVVVGVVGVFGHYWLARRLWPELRVRAGDVRWIRFTELWQFGLVSFASRTASTLAVQAGPIIAMSVLGATAVGLYTVATTLVQHCLRIVEQLGVVIYPTIMKQGGTNDLSAMRTTFILYSRLVMVVGGLLYFGVVVFGEAFIRLWLGPQVVEAATVAAILAAAELAAVFTSTATLILFSLGRLRTQLAIALSHAVSIVAASVLFTAALGLGLIGLALGTLIPSVLFLAGAYPVAAAREIQLDIGSFYLGTLLRLLVVGAIAIVGFKLIVTVTGTSSWPHLLSGIAFATISYMILAAPLALGSEGLRRLRPLLSRFQ